MTLRRMVFSLGVVVLYTVFLTTDSLNEGTTEVSQRALEVTPLRFREIWQSRNGDQNESLMIEDQLNITNLLSDLNGNITTSQLAPIHKPHTVTIVVVGRKGSGVSSTIRELIGSQTKCVKPKGEETLQNIYEYTIGHIPGTDSQIKLVDIPGFTDNQTLEKESQILATIKSYVRKSGEVPDFFLALSRFDEDLLDGIDSPFLQFIKRLEIFENEFLGKNSAKNMDIIFLLTRLMSESESNQRSPETKIANFKKIIEDFSSFPPPPYHFIVGDNNAHSEHNATEENGYYLLPNGKLYPKNIWEAMLSSSISEADGSTAKLQKELALTAILNNREVEMDCKVQLIQTEWDDYHPDAEAFQYLFLQENRTVEQNEVNEKIQEAFDELPQIPDQMDLIVQKTALQLYLQNENITNGTHVPSSLADQHVFFLKSPLVSSPFPGLILNFTLGIQMAEYVKALTIGYGYDILNDEFSLETPFKITNPLPSPAGYQLSNFMRCRKLPIPEIKTYRSYSHSNSEYLVERLKDMKFARKENIKGRFYGMAKEGYNIVPEAKVEIATLTAAKEVRILECVLAEKDNWGKLNPEFLEMVNSLEPVNFQNRDCITNWNVFFRKYGTHIVAQGYGGGMMVGSIIGADLRKVFESQSVIDDTLNSILTLSPFSIHGLEKPTYRLIGGKTKESSTQISRLYHLTEDQRSILLRKWDESLNSNFEMLKHELTLQRISTVVREKIDDKKGEMMDEAIELLLRGGLKYQRKKNNSSTRGSTQRFPTKDPISQTNMHLTLSHGESSSTDYNATQNTSTTTEATYEPGHTDITNMDTQLEEMIKRMREQIEQDNASVKARMEHIRRMDEEVEKKHKHVMEELENQARNWRTTESSNSPGYYPVNTSSEKTDTTDSYYDEMIRKMKEQIEREKVEGKARLEELKRMNEETDKIHALEMKEVAKQAEIDKNYERICFGFNKISPHCWSKQIFHNHFCQQSKTAHYCQT